MRFWKYWITQYTKPTQCVIHVTSVCLTWSLICHFSTGIVHKVYSVLQYIYFPSHCKAAALCEVARHSDWRANRKWLCAKITLHVTLLLYPTNEDKGYRGLAKHGGPLGCSWRRVTRQVWFCMGWTGRTACLLLPWQELPSCEVMEIPAAIII